MLALIVKECCAVFVEGARRVQSVWTYIFVADDHVEGLALFCRHEESTVTSESDSLEDHVVLQRAGRCARKMLKEERKFTDTAAIYLNVGNRCHERSSRGNSGTSGIITQFLTMTKRKIVIAYPQRQLHTVPNLPLPSSHLTIQVLA